MCKASPKEKAVLFLTRLQSPLLQVSYEKKNQCKILNNESELYVITTQNFAASKWFQLRKACWEQSATVIIFTRLADSSCFSKN